MDVYILDALLRPIDVVDEYQSLIWTERFSVMGDCELVTLSTLANKKRFVKGTRLIIAESTRVMSIERIDESTNADGQMILKIIGYDLVKILELRVALKAISGPGIAPSWVIPGMTPANVMRHIFNEICVIGSISIEDVIPFFYDDNVYPLDNIPEPADLIDWEQKPTSVYAAQKELADIYDLGFRLYKDPNLSKLYFNVYSGSNRTTDQTVLPPVIFSTDMENLQSTQEFSDISTSFNTVQVVYIHKDDVDPDLEVAEMLYVYADDDAPPTEGFERRAKVLVITSVPEEVLDIPTYLIRCGKDELMKSRPIEAFDGEITQTTQYVYERDYYLGDLVEFRGSNGSTGYMRVEEFIRVSDQQGERSYPTLVTKKFIGSGTWKSWKYKVPWNAMGSGEFWNNQ